MSGLLAGARRKLSRGTPLDERLAGLEQAVEHARGRLDDDVVERAAAVVERAGARLRLSADHTVVALAGATGSGKSSTFNRLAGLDLAAVGVRRPTTSWATACVWGNDGAGELLEWLGIPPRHQVSRDSMLDSGKADSDLHGLVLLDLPDHDSTEVSHHLEAERLVELADLMVWVLDPQKYADAAIHDRFLKPMAAHGEVMLVVLNHIDEVPEQRRAGMVDDVRRLLVADGLHDVTVIAASAQTGEGMAELRAEVSRRVADKASTRTRLLGDVTGAADELAGSHGSGGSVTLQDKDKRAVVDALGDAAGVPIVVEAVQKATTLRARRATGFPLTAWLSRLRPDPLRRLRLDVGGNGRDIVAAARSSMPRADQVQRARVETTVRGLSDDLTSEMSRSWGRAVRRASTSRFDDLTDGLDQAIARTDLGMGGTPVWCRGVRVVQWLLLAAALVGLVWLGALAVVSYLQLGDLGAPDVSGFPLPTLLLLGGLLAGVLLALLSRALVAMTARRRARRAQRRLHEAVAAVAEELVIVPLERELEAHRLVSAGLRAARG